ncbi:hypothetical protein KC352_g29273, partial [Hortaea werneckii]
MANYAFSSNASSSTVTSFPKLTGTNETAKPSTAYSTDTGGNATAALTTAEPYTGMATRTAQPQANTGEYRSARTFTR